MKKITAYVNTVRVHWLVEALQNRGVSEIMAAEYFRPTSQISRLEFFCEDAAVASVKTIIRRIGTTGVVTDQSVTVQNYDPALPSQIPVGKRMSRLQESRIKQLINVMLKGLTAKLSVAFLVITICIFAVAFFVHTRIGTFEEYLNKTSKNIRERSEAVNQIQQGLLSEMLAAEHLHRGNVISAVKDFQVARSELKEAIDVLEDGNRTSPSALDSIIVLERRFQSVVGGMFAVIEQLSASTAQAAKVNASALSKTHQEIMISLERDRLQLLELLRSFQKMMSERSAMLESDVERAIVDVQISLTILVALAGLISLGTWLVAERKVARPLKILVQEAKTIDTGELK